MVHVQETVNHFYENFYNYIRKKHLYQEKKNMSIYAVSQFQKQSLRKEINIVYSLYYK